MLATHLSQRAVRQAFKWGVDLSQCAHATLGACPRFLYTLERMSALWPGSAAAVKTQLLMAARDAARLGGDPSVLALDALRRAAASGKLPEGGLLDDLRPLLKGDALVKSLHPAVQLSVLALLRELLPELLEDRAGTCWVACPCCTPRMLAASPSTLCTLLELALRRCADKTP